MALPSDFDTVTVTGRYIDLAGNALVGTVTFTSSTTVVDASVPVTIVPVPLVATLDPNGAFSIALPATDDPDISPNGYTYKVEERFGGKLLRTYSIQVPYDTVGSIDLATIAPVQPVTASVQLLPLSGGTMTGPLILSGDPTADLGAATKQYVDAVDLTNGGEINGPLTVNATEGSSSPPLGVSGALHKGINLISSYAGGDDDGTGTDSTGRLNLYSYQRANVKSFGENIRNFLMRSDAKTMQAFYIPVQSSTKKGGYDPATRDPMASGIGWKPVVWQGAHYEANNHASIHGHWELEIADSTGALQGRLEIPFIDQAVDGTKALDQAVIGVDYTNIRTNLADLSVRAQNITSGPYAGQTTCLRVGGGNDRNKEIHLSISSDMGTASRRWVLRATSETESGSNAGTNFQIARYDDSGALLDTPLVISRSTGNVTLTPGLVVRRASSTVSSVSLNTTSLGGGVGVLAMGNATTAPASNPTGGVVLYVSNGRLKIRQPDGTDQFVALTAT
jgi:hypothetical protein